MIDPTTNMLAGPPTSQSPGGAMTLEMAIRDWQQRLDKQAAEIERLRAERDAWRKLVCNHNALVAELKRRIIWPDQNMWPEAYRIDIPPELEPKP